MQILIVTGFIKATNMKIKNKKKLLKELAKGAENPKQFIKCIMILQNMEAKDVVKAANMSLDTFYAAICDIVKGTGMREEMCIRIAKGLDIDPCILTKVVYDYKIKLTLNKNNHAN